jgi:D-glycero-D-manno-heptose 1,7-bisphosphate phosphatase
MITSSKAVFLDRDGVLIREVGYLSRIDQIQVFPEVPAGLAKLLLLGYRLIVITNQSGVARGYFPERFVEQTFQHINALLANQKVQLEAQYYCPHHPQGNPPYNITCTCRKPATGLIDRAVEELGIDLTTSFMIGDKHSDIELAVKAGLKSILLTTGHGAREAPAVAQSFPATPILPSFRHAVDWIVDNTPDL